MKIVDFHTHAFPEKIATEAIEQLEEHYQLQISNTGTLDNLVNKCEEAGLYKAVVHNAALVPEQVKAINNWLLTIENDNLVKFGTMHPDFSDYETELARIKAKGIKGIKLHPDFQKFNMISKKAYAIYEAIGNDFLVLFHIGDEVEEPAKNYSTPRKLAQIIADFPELRVVAAHLGGYQMWDEVKEYLLGEDIYIDTSSTFDYLSSAEIVNIIRAHGVEKVLFGSDFPVKTPATELGQLSKLDLNLVERMKILSQNGLKLLKELGIE